MVESAQFEAFSEMRKALHKNSSELLRDLMIRGYEEIIRVNREIEPDTDANFESNIEKLNKQKGW